MSLLQFESSVGDDIDVVVEGEYDKADPSTGCAHQYHIHRVSLANDRKGTDIMSLLTDAQINRLKEEGREYGSVS